MVLLYLEHEWCGGRGEIQTLSNVGLRIILGHVALDDNSLGCSLFSYQQNSLGKSLNVFILVNFYVRLNSKAEIM